MDNKKLILIGAGAFLLMTMMRSNAQVKANTQTSSANSVLNTVFSGLGRLFGGWSSSGTSKPYGGVMPSQATIDAAANASNRDQDPDLNGSVSDYTSTDGVSVNNPISSAYDYTRESWY